MVEDVEDLAALERQICGERHWPWYRHLYGIKCLGYIDLTIADFRLNTRSGFFTMIISFDTCPLANYYTNPNVAVSWAWAAAGWRQRQQRIAIANPLSGSWPTYLTVLDRLGIVVCAKYGSACSSAPRGSVQPTYSLLYNDRATAALRFRAFTSQELPI
jgi:hypothetical protein